MNSVVTQTLNDIEIICIDDGSFDNSFEIVKNYSAIKDNFIILKQKNKGSGFSRNRAIKISRGKYIAFLDSDDLYFDEKVIENLYYTAKNNRAIICGGGVRRFEFNNTINDIIFEDEGFIKFMDYQFDFYYQRFIYNKIFLKKKKINFPTYLRFQDPPFFIKAMAYAKRFYAVKTIIYKYRCNEKYTKLNLKQTIDLFHGYRDCLKLEIKMGLYKLYSITIGRLNKKAFIERLIKYSDNLELKAIIRQIINIIKKNKKNNSNYILDKIYKNISKIERI